MSVGLALALACGGSASDPVGAAGGPHADRPTEAGPSTSAAEQPAAYPSWDLWSDCTAFCEAAAACGLGDAGGPMACVMRCDLAAQWEGQEQPNEVSEAIRDELVCAVGAGDCAALGRCLTE